MTVSSATSSTSHHAPSGLIRRKCGLSKHRITNGSALSFLLLAGDLTKLADLAREWGMDAIEAEARLSAARDLTERGRYEEADEQLEQAMAFYRTVGATRYIREAQAVAAMRAPD